MSYEVNTSVQARDCKQRATYWLSKVAVYLSSENVELHTRLYTGSSRGRKCTHVISGCTKTTISYSRFQKYEKAYVG